MTHSLAVCILALVATYAATTASGQNCNVTLTPSTTWFTDVTSALASPSDSSAFVICMNAGTYSGCDSGVSMVSAGGGPTTLYGLGNVVLDCKDVGGAFDIDDATSTIYNIEIKNCGGLGRAARVTGTSHVVFDSVYIHNSSYSGVFVEAADVTIVNSVLENNEYSDDNGGSLYAWYSATVRITNTAIRSSSSIGGGCIYGGPSGPSDNTVIYITDSTVEDCTTSGSGGAIYLYDEAACHIHNSVVANSTASGDGGGIAISRAARLNVTGSTQISDNSAGDDGGGISVQDYSVATLSDSVSVSHNTAASAGGGLYLYSTAPWDPVRASLSGSVTVSYNSADDGGAYYSTSTASYGGGLLTLTDDVSVTHNSASNNGGGVYVDGATGASLTGSVTVSDNTASYDGGGFRVYYGSVVNMTGAVVSGNSAGYSGGAADVKYDSTMNVESSTLTDNTAYWGAGFYATTDTNVTCTQCTVTNNAASSNGGGVFATSCAYFDFTYSSDVSGNTPQQIYISDDCARVVGYTPPVSTSSSTSSSASSSSSPSTSPTTTTSASATNSAATTASTTTSTSASATESSSSSEGWEWSSSSTLTLSSTEEESDSAASRTTVAAGLATGVVVAAVVLLA